MNESVAKAVQGLVAEPSPVVLLLGTRALPNEVRPALVRWCLSNGWSAPSAQVERFLHGPTEAEDDEGNPENTPWTEESALREKLDADEAAGLLNDEIAHVFKIYKELFR